MVKRRIPSLNWLRVFEAAARNESFARAAEHLHMSPPAVSQQIQALETHLGGKLFERGARKVDLTDAGRALLPVVSQSLAAVETTAAAIFGEPEKTTVTLQAVTVLAMSWLPDVLARFEAVHPSLRVSVLTGNLLSDFRTALPGRDPDLQIAFGSAADFPETAEPLFGETLFAVGQAAVVAGLRGPQDLRGCRLIEVATHRAGWHQILAHNGIALEDAQLSMADSSPLALMTAAQGHGLALARAPGTDAMVSTLALKRVPFLGPVSGLQGYWLMARQAAPRSRAARLLRDFLLDEAKRH